MKLSALARTFRTVRYLRPSQVYWRLRYRRERGRTVSVPQLPERIELREDFPEVPLLAHGINGDGSDTSESHECKCCGNGFVDLMERGRFRHLNKTKFLGNDNVDWLLGPVNDDRLWTITLHYHAWAWALAERIINNGDDAPRADACLRRLLGDWIENCDLAAEGSRDLAWNAYAISTRIGWWCRLYHKLGRDGRKNWGELELKFILSMWRQAAFLRNHIEWDLRANHVLRDAVGLAWAGRFFDGPEAREWLNAGTDLALSQSKEQVLADGGHFERSPMYHVHAMEDLLTLRALVEDPAARDSIRETWREMAEFLAWTRHPDGQIPLLNDGGLNGACQPRDMLAVGCRAFNLKIDSEQRKGEKHFEDFGLMVWHVQPWSLFFDVGQIGVDYQPGHAHADTLSLEASFEGERLFVDPGTYGYDDNDQRRYDRATGSHNTVCVDGTNSSEVWHIFRVGRRARPRDVSCETIDGSFRAQGSHNGYAHINGRPCHTRSLDISDKGCLTIVDEITGRGRHSLQGGLLLAPGWTATQSDCAWELRKHNKRIRAEIKASGITLETILCAYSPEYGRRQNVQRLAWRCTVELPWKLTWRIEKHELGRKHTDGK